MESPLQKVPSPWVPWDGDGNAGSASCATAMQALHQPFCSQHNTGCATTCQRKLTAGVTLARERGEISAHSAMQSHQKERSPPFYIDEPPGHEKTVRSCRRRHPHLSRELLQLLVGKTPLPSLSSCLLQNPRDVHQTMHNLPVPTARYLPSRMSRPEISASMQGRCKCEGLRVSVLVEYLL